jgi:hypothetical protein
VEHWQAFAVRVRPLSLWFLPPIDYQGNHGERMDSELLMTRTAYLFELLDVEKFILATTIFGYL